MQLTIIVACHGDRLASARFGPAGGLSQPSRETADPRKIDYYFSIANSQFQATPCDRAFIQSALRCRGRPMCLPRATTKDGLQHYSRFTTTNQPFFT